MQSQINLLLCTYHLLWETFRNSPLFLCVVETCHGGMNFPGSCNVSCWTPCDRYSWRQCQQTCIMPWLMHSLLFLPHSHPPSGSLSSYQPFSSPFSLMAALTVHVCVRYSMEAHFTCITISIFQCSVYRHFQNLKLADLYENFTNHYLLVLEEVFFHDWTVLLDWQKLNTYVHWTMWSTVFPGP